MKVLIYLLRRDLRLADNPIFHDISKLHSQSKSPFTHLLPVYVFPAQQIEISGFLSSSSARSPYPEARSQVGNYWRCGHHRAKFIAESVWDLKKDLEKSGSGLVIRTGTLADVVQHLLEGFKSSKEGVDVAGVWMTEEPGIEEKREERAVRNTLEKEGKEFKLWTDEKYFVHQKELPFSDIKELSDTFSTFRKQVEPLRDAPRKTVGTPESLPPLPPHIPPQADPFSIPENLNDLIAALHKPLNASPDLRDPPVQPTHSEKAKTAHPFKGGSGPGHDRIKHLLESGNMTTYKDTRNGMLGPDFSTKLSAWLALGCITARQVHWYLMDFEDGTNHFSSFSAKGAQGYGKGENKGTAAVRFELLWRDYFQLCTRKFGPRLFQASGFRKDESISWKYDQDALKRWLNGTTGMGLVDAAQRELYLTGYTSNRTRQNVASFLSKHLGLDWRLGAEWYETYLIDYDVGSNWGNWQYNSGVGNDPREGGMGRKFNPVKQAYDYDKHGDYVKTWVEEVKDVPDPGQAFQYKAKAPDGSALDPLVHINFNPRKGGGGGGNRGGGGGGGGGGGPNPGRGRGRGGRGRGSGRDGFSKRELQ